jgi:hypothetical protein
MDSRGVSTFRTRAEPAVRIESNMVSLLKSVSSSSPDMNARISKSDPANVDARSFDTSRLCTANGRPGVDTGRGLACSWKSCLLTGAATAEEEEELVVVWVLAVAVVPTR